MGKRAFFNTLCGAAFTFVAAQTPVLATTVTLTAGPTPILIGQPVTLNVSLTPSNATGAVTFFSGMTFLESAPVAAGQATLVTRFLPFGPNRIVARYNGDGANAPGFSAVSTVSVFSSPASGFNAAAGFGTGVLPLALALGDVNGDGRADLVTANTSDNTVSVLPGNGDGTFASGTAFPTGNAPIAVVIADFNGDGLPDLAIAANSDNAVDVLLGTGSGAFAAFQQYALPSQFGPVALVAGDWNGDGIADLAVVNQDSNTVSILFGRGDGSFVPSSAAPLPVGSAPAAIAAADFNGDGQPDLAVANSADNTVTILLGAAGGTFTPLAAVSAGEGPLALAPVDLNSDGKMDLAVADGGDYEAGFDTGVAVLLANGNGTFQPDVIYFTGYGTADIKAADFTGDGIADLAVAAGDGLEVLAGNGDGTLQPPVSYWAGSTPQALVAGQFDGSALTAAAIASPEDDEVFVLNALPGICTFSLPPTSFLFDANGGPENLVLTASSPGCPWTAAVASWIGVAPSGLGGGPLNVQAQQNLTGIARTGSLTIGSSTVSTTEEATVQQFSDVNPGDFDFDAVDLLHEANVTSGCSATDYCPNNSTTRAQMAIFIVRAVVGGDNFTINRQTPYFADVPPTAFGFMWIQKMFELGITSGCSATNFCPNNSVTRAQMAVFIIRARFGSTVPFDYPATPYFTDVGPTAFGFAWIQRMAFDQITAGCGAGVYCPNSSVTRGQMAVFMMRGLFDALLPAGTPLISQISPATIQPGQTATFTITGSNTSFAQGVTMLAAMPGIGADSPVVLSATQFTVNLTASSTAAQAPVSIFVTTAGQEAILPNGLTVQ